MSTQDTRTTECLGAQLPALRVAVQLAAQYPELPGAYIVQSLAVPGEVEMQIEAAQDLLAWRQALCVEETAVRDRPMRRSDVMREWTTTVDGTSVHFYAIVPAAEAEAVPA
ncbi:hypothetical protein E3E14_25150 [Streptomyces sp. ICN441]|uniref:hypothetical protein n=1 Tax=Streptomyces sp. ICN441 TaxID=2558286 RepID=UPI00106C67F9|nr:hypothetical protein [Streptomyces sp. ICN441]TFE42474.1 hypothetical protein E3E14_25150 [Streptomyces sp. ICN441]